VTRPRVLLPETAALWSRERMFSVLLHEFAHVARRDGLCVLVARVVSSILWFHPLVWVLSNHVRREAERACDDIVLASGVRGSGYAEHLVAIARSATTREPLAASALTLATRSSLEQRVVSILSTRVPRTSASRRALATAACASLALFAVIATARPTPVSSARLLINEAPAASDSYTTAPTFNETKSTTFETAVEYSMTETPPAADDATPRYFLADNDDDNADDHSGREWYGRADDLYHNGRYARAGEAYENAARRGYRRATAYYNAGCSYALSDQKGRAIDALQNALKEGFDGPEYYAGDEDLNSLRDDPRFKELMKEVMNSDTATASRKQALHAYDSLAKDKSVDEGSWNDVGIDLLRTGDYDRAADAFDHEFKVSGDEDALYNKACARALAGKSAEALTLLDQAIKTGTVDSEHMAEDPDLVSLHDEARFDQLVTLAEDLSLNGGGSWNSNQWMWKGNDAKRWRKAIPHFEKVAKDHPDIGRAWFNLGYAQLAADQAAPSTASFKKALDLGYQPKTTMYNLGCSCAQADDLDDAIAWLEKSEKAGMQMWQHARWDNDLEPLHSDPRFKAMEKRWRAEAKKHGQDDDDWDYEYHTSDDKDDDNDTN